MKRASGSIDRETLKCAIETSLKVQGFIVHNGRVFLPPDLTKDGFRQVHAAAVHRKLEHMRAGLERHEAQLLCWVAAGSEVKPEKIRPVLVEVKPRSEEELFFRYASAHWSVPVSSGYGRRLRFLVLDEQNSKVIGLFGLGDPVFSLAERDRWIGWDKETKRQRLRYVMDAFVLGAIPPYSLLLCGKLVAMLVASNEVREAFARKYAGRAAVISGTAHDGQLALITTTSALGRSSLYNRIRYRDRLLYWALGFTRGSGEFHFSNGLYAAISQYALEHCKPTAKHARWGSGFRNRREVVKKCLASLGLSTEWLYHGIRREIFAVPLAENACAFLRGDDETLMPYDQPAADLFAFFRERWLLPRAARDPRYLEFTPDQYRLWIGGEAVDSRG